jgi:hypothetical protein
MHNSKSNIEDSTSGGKPGPEDFLSELQTAIADGEWYGQRANRANDVRFCRWEGQSSDGRKHGAALGRPARPWENASDLRIPTADEIVNDEVRFLMSSMRRAGFQAVGIGIEDMARGQQVTQLLRWQISTQMRDQIRRELELAGQWRQHFGASVLAIEWQQELRRVPVPLTLEDVASFLAGPVLEQAQASGQEVTEEIAAAVAQEAMGRVMDELHEPAIIEVLRGMFPLASKGDARRALVAIRRGEVAELDNAEVFGGGPRWTALQIFTDIFFPVSTWDIQRARWVAHRELVTESELRDRVQTQDYDPDWVDAAIERKGASLVGNEGAWWAGQWGSGKRSISGWAQDEAKDLIEIFHFYYKTSTKGGVPQVRKCVLHPGVPDAMAWSGPLPYDHGMFPYVVCQREFPARCILESRGVSEMADPWQQEIKAQRDARVDRTHLTTLPPVLVPSTRGALRLEFGPGAQWPKRKGEEFEWMKIPPFDGGSIEVERAVERTIDRYFGRISENNPPDRALLYQQHLVDGWLTEIEGAASMTLKLDQQYLPDEIAVRVMGKPMRMSRQEIQGQYDLQMVFDVRNLNAELLKEKLSLLTTLILPLDRFGTVNMAKVVQLTLGAVDPTMAEMVLQSIEDASGQQVTEEQDVLAKMVAGMETPMEPAPGMNYPLRLQVLQESIQANPELQQMIQSRPVLHQMIEARVQFLSFQSQQQQNAIIGRTGAQPVLGGGQ